MAFLGKLRKNELVMLTEELGIKVDADATVKMLKDAVTGDPEYDADASKVIVERLVEERKLSLEAKTCCGSSLTWNQLIPKYNPDIDEMVLYLKSFEARATAAGIPRSEWVAFLMGALPSGMSKQLAREPQSHLRDYEKVKELLLKKYQLNPEELKSKFFGSVRQRDESWRSFAYDLSAYFDEWLNRLEVKTFQQLRDLMISNQMKYRIPPQVKTQFLSDWNTMNEPLDLAEKLDEYELLRRGFERGSNTYGFGERRPSGSSFPWVRGSRDDRSRYVDWRADLRRGEVRDRVSLERNFHPRSSESSRRPETTASPRVHFGEDVPDQIEILDREMS